MPNLRDFKEYVLREGNCQGKISVFCGLSEKHLAFWEKLEKMWDPIKIPLESAQDVDAVIEIPSWQWAALEKEFRELPKQACS